jgi:hypothetical protein
MVWIMSEEIDGLTHGEKSEFANLEDMEDFFGNNILNSVNAQGVRFDFTPFRLFTLLEMIKIPARHITDVMRFLLKAETDFKEVSDAHVDAIISNQDSEWLLNNIPTLLEWIEELGMQHPIDECLELIVRVFNRLKLKETEFRASEQGYTRLYHDIRQIRGSLEFYLQKIFLLYMPADHVLYYECEDLFGVKDKFPEANKEIKSAGNCYATENYTACVFHLMRAVEIGGKALFSFMKATKHLPKVKGGKRHKPISLCTWGELRNAMQLALDEQKKNGLISEKRKEIYQFCNDAVEAFGHFQNAWRDRVSHSSVVYEKYDADKIMHSTERLMKLLATKIKATK